MYYCLDCQEEFEELNFIQEPHNEIDAPFAETYGICPICGSGDYEEMEECNICNGFIVPERSCTCSYEIWDSLNETLDGICERHNCERKDLTEVITRWVENL